MTKKWWNGAIIAGVGAFAPMSALGCGANEEAEINDKKTRRVHPLTFMFRR